jgi:hypothetical protein
MFLWKYFARQIYSYSFLISKLNDLKVIHDLYSQCLTQILSKTTSSTKLEGVLIYLLGQSQLGFHECFIHIKYNVTSAKFHFLHETLRREK